MSFTLQAGIGLFSLASWTCMSFSGSQCPASNGASVSAPVTISDSDIGNNIASDGPDARVLFRDGFE